VLKNLFFAGILKVNDENRRIRIQDPDLNPDPDPLVRGMDPRIQDPDPNPDPDPLVRGMDPRIRIRIHPKMSWIRNTALLSLAVISRCGKAVCDYCSSRRSTLPLRSVFAVFGRNFTLRQGGLRLLQLQAFHPSPQVSLCCLWP
jgi:hypothetical protein